jgi:hypothetical protein
VENDIGGRFYLRISAASKGLARSASFQEQIDRGRISSRTLLMTVAQEQGTWGAKKVIFKVEGGLLGLYFEDTR